MKVTIRQVSEGFWRATADGTVYDHPILGGTGNNSGFQHALEGIIALRSKQYKGKVREAKKAMLSGITGLRQVDPRHYEVSIIMREGWDDDEDED